MMEDMAPVSNFWLACILVDMILETDLKKAARNEKEALRRWLR
jgi:hypothetical protein